MRSPIYILRKAFDRIYKRKIFSKKILSSLLLYNYKSPGIIYDKVLNFEYSLSSDIGYSLYLYKKFEEEEINFVVAKLLQKKEPVIFDIGANIGLHSILWANTLPSLKIFAFEPSQSTRQLLNNNITYHSLQKNIQVYPLAFSSVSGKALFYQSSDDGYSSLKDTKRKEITGTYEVTITTIDNFIKENKIEKIDFIKIDVEGLEQEVLSGGLKTFEKFHPDLFVEIYGGINSNINPELTVRMMIERGYKAFVFKHGNLETFVSHSDEFYNYYFTKS